MTYTVVLAMREVFADSMVEELRMTTLDLVIRRRNPAGGPLQSNELKDVDAVVVSGVPITGETVRSAGRLRLIQKWGAGVDEVDIDAAVQADIVVANVPGGNSISVAEHFFALLLTLRRRIHESTPRISKGEWPQADLLRAGIYDLDSKTLGLIGFGNVGRRVAGLGKAFGMSVIYNKRTRLSSSEELAQGLGFGTVGDVMRESDVVGIVASGTSDGSPIVNNRQIELMKPSAVLINVARGHLVDERAVLQALQNGIIHGYATDVMCAEPFTNHTLLDRRDVIATPHVAGRSREAMALLSAHCRQNLEAALEGRRHDITGRVDKQP